MSRIPIGLQLYSVRSDCEEDFPATLKAISEMGYDGVDFAGYYGYSAAEIKQMMDDVGLVAAGCHTGISSLVGDAINVTIEFNHILGNKYLIIPGLPEQYRSSSDAWLHTAELFNTIADKLEPEGMYTGYHNHFIEFVPIDGVVPWELFYSNTGPRVIHQIDTGNAIHGGGTPEYFIRKFPGRSITVHLKEYSATNDKAVIGEGDTNWHDIFHLCETIGGTQWYIVEQESYAYPPLECVDRCLKALKNMGK